MSAFKADVLVIAGTFDARQIISELLSLKLKVLATVTTRFGNELIEKHPNVRVFEKKLTCHGMAKLIKAYVPKCLIDASHPFAIEASANAMKACNMMGIKYLRYERSEVKGEFTNVTLVKTYEEAYKHAVLTEGNILLTIGSNKLGIFFAGKPEFKERLFARVLPDSESILKCEKAGLSRGNILALKGPFSEAFNIEIMKHIDAKVLITKDSGSVGGTDEKLKAAQNLGIRVILIDRPTIEYVQKVETITEVVYWVGNTVANSIKNFVVSKEELK